MSDKVMHDAIGRLAGRRIFGEVVRGPLLTARQLRDFIDTMAARHPEVLDYPVHYLNIEDADEGTEAQNYATSVELDAFATESGDDDTPAVKVLSILREFREKK